MGEWVKGLYTAMPGIVTTYDAATRRASVQPAIDLLTIDDRLEVRPVIPDVPVVWPTAGGFTLLAPLATGDPVLLVFSSRGLTGFKRMHARSAPDIDRLLSMSDAIAIPGFGPVQVTPVSTTGIVLQNEAATDYVAIEPDGIRIRTSGKLTLTDRDGVREL